LTHSVTAYIALGANLGDAKRTIQQTIVDLATLPGTSVVKASSLYQTAPIDSAGPDYINAVVQVLTGLGPYYLLKQLQNLEQAAGRERPYAKAPRTLDLDLLIYGSAQITSPTLTVPHPRMAQRAFVLLPLAQIAPDLVSAGDLRKVSAQGVVPLFDSVLGSFPFRVARNYPGLS
jgi:2-amino-4-hydroxy-6-hydroxymethyldihydropteridine diphosphokinase